MVVGEAREHPRKPGQVEGRLAGGRHAADDQGHQGVAIRGDPLSLTEHLADQPPTPQSQPPGHPRIGLDSRPHPVDGEVRVPGVGTDVEHQGTGGGVEVGGHLPVEIGPDPITHVGLDQPLQPVRRRGGVMEAVDTGDERVHRHLGV